jgi:hypothetical protein
MSESASRTFTKTVKNEAGEKPCRVNRLSHCANHRSRIQAQGEVPPQVAEGSHEPQLEGLF